MTSAFLSIFCSQMVRKRNRYFSFSYLLSQDGDDFLLFNFLLVIQVSAFCEMSIFFFLEGRVTRKFNYMVQSHVHLLSKIHVRPDYSIQGYMKGKMRRDTTEESRPWQKKNYRPIVFASKVLIGNKQLDSKQKDTQKLSKKSNICLRFFKRE